MVADDYTPAKLATFLVDVIRGHNPTDAPGASLEQVVQANLEIAVGYDRAAAFREAIACVRACGVGGQYRPDILAALERLTGEGG